MTRAARRLKTLRAAVGAVVGLLFVFPIYITLCTSLDTPAHVFTYPPHLWLDFDWSSWVQAWKLYNWLRFFFNTIAIALCTIAIALTTSVLAAYALSFIRFRGQEIVFATILVVLMIPSETFLIPNFVIMANLHLVDTLAAQILPYGASVFGIFLLRQFFLSLPRDYFEAARVDGCGHVRFLWSVALPMCRPVLITLALYIFIGTWNSLIWPLMVAQNPSVQPIELALATFLTSNSSDWQGLSAASMFATLPIIVIFLFLERYIIRGISRGDGIRM